MGDRHENFEDPSTWGRDMRKTKFDLLIYYWYSDTPPQQSR